MTPAWDPKQFFWENYPSRKHPGGIQEPRELERAFSILNRYRSHAKYSNLPFCVIFTTCFWRSVAASLIFTMKNLSPQPSTWRPTFQGPFTNTVRTPTAKDCLGNYVFIVKSTVAAVEVWWGGKHGWETLRMEKVCCRYSLGGRAPICIRLYIRQ